VKEVVNVLLENVTKWFGKVVAVNNLTLEIENNDFMVLLGPSGCGKTTTLRLIAGLETPDEGNIYIGGVLANDLSPKERNVAMVFQKYALYPYMTVFDNIAFPLKIRKMPANEIREEVRRVAELLKIEHLLERKPRQLSGGQQQRVALARALIRKPQLFLMDEPLSNLDAKLRILMRTELKKLHQTLKITTIYVTHDQEEAMTLGTRIAIMNEGVLQQTGSPLEVYNQPANMFVAGFIGSPAMNMLDGELIQKDGEIIGDFGIISYPVPLEVAEKCSSKKIVLGVRPEHITLSEKKLSGAFKAKVEVIEPIGREYVISISADGTSLTVLTKLEKLLQPEDEVWVKFDEERMHIFDRETKKRLGRPGK
jgi:multiple sugar transport system ATP-binding protein